MPEKLLSSKTATQRAAELADVSKATGLNYSTSTLAPTATIKPVGQQSPTESSPGFTKGTDIAGTKVKLANGTDYIMKGGSSGAPAPVTPAPVTTDPGAPTIITPSGNTAVETTPAAPEAHAPATTTTPAGIDVEALKRSGLDQTQIQKILDLANPQLRAEQQSLASQDVLKNAQEKNLQESYDAKQKLYDDMAAQDKMLADKKQQLIDDSAAMQTGIMEQQKAQETMIVEQERAKFELARTREERTIQEQNMQNEQQTSRAIASSLGMAFSSFGIARVVDVRQRGEAILSDARAQTAIGEADYTIRLADIERNYGKEVNNIEISRRDLQIQNLTTLNEQLQGVDEKKLLSEEEKKTEANAIIKSYLENTDKINNSIADILTDTVKSAQDKAQALLDEKKANETADLELSAGYGYFVNKWGQPVNKQLNGQPTPFVGQYDEKMSAQFGYLVDNKGNAIRDNKGGIIKYEDPDMAAFNSALKAYASGGDLSESDRIALNGKVGTNNVISTTLENGKRYESSNPNWDGLQCGEYLSSRFYVPGARAGSTYDDADAAIAKYGGGTLNTHEPNVGDTLFVKTGDKRIPHKAIVEGKNPDGSLIITDANWIGAGVVSHGRVVTKDSSFYRNIYGVASIPLKESVILGQPVMTTNTSTDGSVPARNPNQEMAQKLLLAAASSKAGVPDSIIKDLFGNSTAAQNFDAGSTSDLETAQKMAAQGLINMKTGKAQIPADTTVDEKTWATGAAKMFEAERIFDAYTAHSNLDLTTVLDFLGTLQVAPDGTIPGVVFNKAMGGINDPAQKEVLKAIQRFVEGKLRKDSGAAIGIGEYLSTAQMFFPDPGDSSSNTQTLKFARQNVINGAVASSGRAAPIYYAAVLTAPNVKAQQTQNKIPNAINAANEGVKSAIDSAKELVENTVVPGAGGAAKVAGDYLGYASDYAKQNIDYVRQQIPGISDDEIKQWLKDNNIQ